MQLLRRAAHRLVEALPDDLKDDPDAILLREVCCNAAVTIVHLIHRRKNYETQSMDYEFSRFSINEHWDSGQNDVRRTFRHKDWQTRSKSPDDVRVFDLAVDARD
jgi:NTE family protein